MQITILVERRDSVIKFATALVLASAFVSLPFASDTYQPVRAILVAIAMGVAALAASRSVPLSKVGRFMIAAGLLFAIASASALVNGPASALWGVHGRFQGLLSLTLMLVTGAVGAMSFGGTTRFMARASAVAVVLQVLVIGFQLLAGDVPDGTMGNRVLTGSWLAVLVATSAAAAYVENAPVRRWLLVAAGSGAIAMGVVGSRGAWFGLVVAAVVVIATVRPSMRRALPVAAIVLLVAVGALVSDSEALTKLNPASLSSGSAASRFQIWRGTAAMIGDNPALGVGPGRYLYEFPEYQPTAHAVAEVADVRPDQAHSQLMQLVAESGVPAGAAVLVLITFVGIAGYRQARKRDAASLIALAGLTAYVGQGVFGIATVETSALGWLMGGILVGRAAMDRDMRDTRTTDVGSPFHAFAVAGMAGVIALSAGWYLVADVSYTRGLELFGEADFPGAIAAYDSATSMNPLTDVYRVARADAAAYMGGQAASEAYDSLQDGLELEPASYDLELAQAELVGHTGDADQAVQEYLEAVERYPLGLHVRLAAMSAMQEAGRLDEAQEMALNVLALYPDEPTAVDVLKGAADVGP